MNADLITTARRLALAPFHLVFDRLGMLRAGPLDDLEPGEGRVVDVAGRKLAAYRDSSGEVQAVSPVCTHLRCVVHFNADEQSWDCPCHGSRFALDGEVLEGPAKSPLERVAVD